MTEDRLAQLTAGHWRALNAIPEPALAEHRTAEYIEGHLDRLGLSPCRRGTAVRADIDGVCPGRTVAVRADMDGLWHGGDGERRLCHSCGHDAHMAVALALAEMLVTTPLPAGRLRLIFQPAEETAQGAVQVAGYGWLDDVHCLLGMHLRPADELAGGCFSPAVHHGATRQFVAEITGQPAHAARPHLGVSAVDAGVLVVQAINSLRFPPALAWSVKCTAFNSPATANIIPDRAVLSFDARAQHNRLIEQIAEKAEAAAAMAARAGGAELVWRCQSALPAAEYDDQCVAALSAAIVAQAGESALHPPIVTPGGDDFHFCRQLCPHLKTAFLGIGCDLRPGLHHPSMTFDLAALPAAVRVLAGAARILGGEKQQ
ncbi:MAG: amidohydrolase [Negativicutes bacterium]|nr:amidohydrolase [Negativicutes bacterium]